MLPDAVMQDGGGGWPFSLHLSSLQPSQDTPRPPASPPDPTLPVLLFMLRATLIPSTELDSILYVLHLFTLEAEFAASFSAPFLNIMDHHSHNSLWLQLSYNLV